MEEGIEIPGLLNQRGTKGFLGAIVAAEAGKRCAQREECARVAAGFLHEGIHCRQSGLAFAGPVERLGAQQADRWFGAVHVRQIRQRFLTLFIIRCQAGQLQIGV